MFPTKTFMKNLIIAAFITLNLTACGISALDIPVSSILPQPKKKPILALDGQCEGTPPETTNLIDLGITECELVRIKGKTPSDVLVGQNGVGAREVQVLYSEPAAKEIYMFIDNTLTRIIK